MNTKKLYFYLGFIPAILWAEVIYILLTLPNKDFDGNPFEGIPNFDKLVHAGLFGGLTFLLILPFWKRKSYNAKRFKIIPIIVLAYGIAMEFVQKYFTKDRDFGYSDMAADAVGVIIGYFIASYFVKYLQKRRNLGLQKL